MSRFDRVASGVVLGFGAVLRVREYVGHRALWLDELAVTTNIVHRSYARLWQPLGNNQAAPVGWLWAEKSAITVFGNTDWMLRLVPFALSLGSLVLFFILLRQWSVTGAGLVVASALFALSPTLLRYSDEVKQYGTDVFFVLLVLSVSTRLMQTPTTRNAALWATACVVAMWCSYPAILVTAGCAIVLLVREIRHPATRRPLVGASIVVGVSAAAEYLTTLRSASGNRRLVRYWHRAFAPQPFRVRQAADWLWDAFVILMKVTTNLSVPAFALFLLGLGIIVFVRRRGAGALMLFAPLAIGPAAALVRKYPFGDRLAIYLLPIVFLGLAGLLEAAPRLRARALRAAGYVIVLGAIAVVAAPLARNGVRILSHPIAITDSRGPFAFVADHREPADLLFVENPWSFGAYEYYGTQDHLRLDGGFLLTPGGAVCSERAAFLRLGAGTRVWFVMTHRPSGESTNRASIFATFFRSLGVLRLQYQGLGQAGAYLYEVRRAPVPTRSVNAWVEHACLKLDSPPHLT